MSQSERQLNRHEITLVREFMMGTGEDIRQKRIRSRIAAELLKVRSRTITTIMQEPEPDEHEWSMQDLIRDYVAHGKTEEDKKQRRRDASDFFGLSLARVSAITAWSKIWTDQNKKSGRGGK